MYGWSYAFREKTKLQAKPPISISVEESNENSIKNLKQLVKQEKKLYPENTRFSDIDKSIIEMECYGYKAKNATAGLITVNYNIKLKINKKVVTIRVSGLEEREEEIEKIFYKVTQSFRLLDKKYQNKVFVYGIILMICIFLFKIFFGGKI